MMISRALFLSSLVALSPALPALGQTKPAGTTSKPASTIFQVPPLPIFPVVLPDPIERPEFRTTPHPIAKSVTSATAMMVRISSDGSMMGMTSDIIATVPADSRSGSRFEATFVAKQADVGAEMKTSFDEAVRAVKLRYPKWEAGNVVFSFGEKYTPHDGGSAGTCFATMLLSELEGFEIDGKCAVTGDITVDWKVRKIGGTAAKLRGATADHCLYAGIPEGNAPQIADMILLYGDASVRDLQIFSLTTLQDAVALLRTDRAPRLAEAMKEFADLQPRMKAGRSSLSNPEIQKALQQIVTLAPNHESAKWLLEIAKGSAPRTLSDGAAFYNIMVAMYPYRNIIMEGSEINRQTVLPGTTLAARKQLGQIRPITPRELQPLLVDSTAIIETAESIALRTAQPTAMNARREAFVAHYRAMAADKDLLEKLIRQGF